MVSAQETGLQPADIVVTDVSNATLLRVEREQEELALISVSTISSHGDFQNLYGVAIDARNEVLYAVDKIAFGGAVFRIDPADGTPVLISAGDKLLDPSGIVVAPDGSLVVACAPGGGGDRIVRVDPATGFQTVVSEGGFFVGPARITLERDGSILVSDDGSSGPGAVIRVDPSTGAQTLVSRGEHLVNPYGIAVEADGTILVADEGSGAILRIDPMTGEQTVFVDSLDRPTAVTVDIDCSILINQANTIVRLDPTTGAVLGSYDTGAGRFISSIAVVPLPDGDDDGVPDDKDLCPDTPEGTVVDANGCASQVVDPANGFLIHDGNARFNNWTSLQGDLLVWSNPSGDVIRVYIFSRNATLVVADDEIMGGGGSHSRNYPIAFKEWVVWMERRATGSEIWARRIVDVSWFSGKWNVHPLLIATGRSPSTTANART
jgi:streptogramin lyase